MIFKTIERFNERILKNNNNINYLTNNFIKIIMYENY